MTSSNGNIFRVTGLLCWEFTGPVNSPHKGQWRGTLVFSLICACVNSWANNRDAGDWRHHRVHYDVIVMNKVYEYFGLVYRGHLMVYENAHVWLLIKFVPGLEVLTFKYIRHSFTQYISCALPVENWHMVIYRTRIMFKVETILDIPYAQHRRLFRFW